MRKRLPGSLCVAAILLAAMPVSAVAQHRPAALESGGSVSQALVAFRAICVAHPGDPAAQRRAALAAKPRRFEAEPGSPKGIDSYSAWPVQLSLLETDRGRVCAVLSPLTGAPDEASALAEVRRGLALGPGAIEEGERVWHRTARGMRSTIAFAIPIKVDALGAPRATATLTLVSQKVR